MDALYMEATIQMTGGGGWPMTVFLTPDGAPILAGTYFPPEPRHGMPAFPTVLARVADWYATKRDEVEAQAQAAREMYRSQAARTLPMPPGLLEGEAALDPTVLARAANTDLGNFDAQDGGLQRAPKFPHALGLEFLLRMERRRRASGAARAAAEGLSDDLLPLVTLTLDKMAAGGIYDQIGGGFHRYLDGRHLARAALREDALRQRAARARLPATPGRSLASRATAASARRRSTTSCAR